MKKVIVLFASPKENGFTKTLLDVFLSKCRYEIQLYHMYEENILPCIGCEKCASTKKCFMEDADHILSDIFSSDYVIFASPVYNYSFPSPMKAFLDRLQPYFSMEKSAPVRKGFLLASCGKSGKFSVDVLEKQSKMAFHELSAEFFGSYFFTNTDKQSVLQQDEICKVTELAERFFS